MGAVVLSSMVVVANVMGAGMIVPQVLRLQRGRNAAGVSPIWVGVGVALNAWWVVYAVGEQVWGVAPVTATSAVLYLVIAAQLTRLSGASAVIPRVLLGAAVSSLVPGLALVVGGIAAAGLAVGFSYAVQFAPAVWAVTRAERAEGVAPSTWAMALVEAVAWFAYGLAVADAALVIGGGGGAVMASVIVWQLAAQQAAARRPLAVAAT